MNYCGNCREETESLIIEIDVTVCAICRQPHELPTFRITIAEVIALLRECEHSYISYENPIAKDLLNRMVDFRDENK